MLEMSWSKPRRMERTMTVTSNPSAAMKPAHSKGLARSLLLPKNIIGADATLLHTRVVSIRRSAATSYENVFGRSLLHFAFAVVQRNGVWILESRKGIVVLHSFASQVCFRTARFGSLIFLMNLKFGEMISIHLRKGHSFAFSSRHKIHLEMRCGSSR